jgi:uncharacterized protein YndB with AHSA1/START domain
MAHYEFVDHWYIKAPIDVVYRHVSDASTYPQWWPVYPQVDILQRGDDSGVGGRARLVVKSALSYQLTLEVETVTATPPTYLKTIARGQLEGTGIWQFEETGGVTHALFTWIVDSHHPLLNLVEPIAKPLFRWSHDDASAKGHRGLKHLLEQPVAQQPVSAKSPLSHA